MNEWLSPLWFLAVPVALAAPWLARRPRVAVSSLAALSAPTTLRAALSWLPQLLASLGLVFLVVALARPVEVNRERVVEREGIDILLALDFLAPIPVNRRIAGTNCKVLIMVNSSEAVILPTSTLLPLSSPLPGKARVVEDCSKSSVHL